MILLSIVPMFQACNHTEIQETEIKNIEVQETTKNGYVKLEAKEIKKTNKDSYKLILDGISISYEDFDISVFNEKNFEFNSLKISDDKKQKIVNVIGTLKKSDEKFGLESAYGEGSLWIKIIGSDDTNIYLIENDLYKDGNFWYNVESSNASVNGIYKTDENNNVKKEIEKIINE